MTPDQATAFAEMVEAANELAKAERARRKDPDSEAAKQERARAGVRYNTATSAYSAACAED